MTSFSVSARNAPRGTPDPRGIAPPTFAEWTEAHREPDANRRRVRLALLHDRLIASSMRPWPARLYLKRHVLGWAARWSLLVPLALWVTPWMWVFVLGIPALSLYQSWQASRHG